MKKLLTIISVFIFFSGLFAQANFNTSLHKTREGKSDAYKSGNGGMELITNIPMSQLACQKCHSTTETYPNGDPINPATYAPSCNDCHNFAAGSTVTEQTCINCHNRQNYERQAYPNTDKHTLAGLTCKSCHSKAELHGDDGVAYASLKQEGAIKVKCVDCHNNLSSNSSHTIHSATVDCAACHAVSVLTCAGCHFETVVAIGKNRAINQIKNYRLLVKKNGKVHLGGVMSHTFQGKSNFIVSSYHSHIITKNATTCADCHFNLGGTNAPINEYNTTGRITINKWNPDTKKIIGPTGVVPLPKDWKTAFKFDFVTYTGDSTILPSDPNLWVYLKSEVDNSHLFYCEPLDSSTLAKLGVTRFTTDVDPVTMTPTSFELKQNYPNPFNPSTILKYSLPVEESVTIQIFDIQGKLVSTLLNKVQKSAGSYEITWNGTDDLGNKVNSGIYLAKMTAGKFTQAHKMTLIK